MGASSPGTEGATVASLVVACALAATLFVLDKLQRMRGRYGSWALWLLVASCTIVAWLDVTTFGDVRPASLGFGAAFGAVAGAAALGMLVARRLLALEESPAIARLRDAVARHPLSTAVLFVACAPIIEESIYRGVLLRALWPHGAALAVLVTLGLFVALHLDVRSVAPLVVIGVTFTVVAISGGVVAAIVAHAVSNAVGFIFGVPRRQHAYAARTTGSEEARRDAHI